MDRIRSRRHPEPDLSLGVGAPAIDLTGSGARAGVFASGFYTHYIGDPGNRVGALIGGDKREAVAQFIIFVFSPTPDTPVGTHSTGVAVSGGDIGPSAVGGAHHFVFPDIVFAPVISTGVTRRRIISQTPGGADQGPPRKALGIAGGSSEVAIFTDLGPLDDTVSTGITTALVVGQTPGGTG